MLENLGQTGPSSYGYPPLVLVATPLTEEGEWSPPVVYRLTSGYRFFAAELVSWVQDDRVHVLGSTRMDDIS